MTVPNRPASAPTDEQTTMEWLDQHAVHTVRTIGVHLDGTPVGHNLHRAAFEHALSLGPIMPAETLLTDVEGEPWLEAPRGWLETAGAPRQRPDLSSLTALGDGVARCMVDHVGADGTPIPICPRARLAALTETLEEHDVALQVHFTLEGVIHRESPAEARTKGHRGLTPVGTAGPSFRHDHQHRSVLTGLAHQLEAQDVAWQDWHSGSDAGQIRLVLAPAPPVRAADQAIAAREALRAAAATMSASMSFLATGPDAKVGNGTEITMHLGSQHQPTDSTTPHPKVMWWIGGLLATAPAASAITNPTVNAYRRVGRFAGAPAHCIWGRHNRSALLDIDSDHRSGISVTQLTHRGCSSDANPHLALAALIAGGLVGLVENLDPPAPSDATSWTQPVDHAPLPRTLVGARLALAEDKLLRPLLGAQLVETWLAARRHEWLHFHRSSERPEVGTITDWELKRYAELG